MNEDLSPNVRRDQNSSSPKTKLGPPPKSYDVDLAEISRRYENFKGENFYKIYGGGNGKYLTLLPNEIVYSIEHSNNRTTEFEPCVLTSLNGLTLAPKPGKYVDNTGILATNSHQFEKYIK